MKVHQKNFDNWYKKVLEKLYPDRDAGIAILHITIPLLERYLRQKANLSSKDRLNSQVFQDLASLFPTLRSTEKARQLWSVVRNGLLHQVSLSRETQKGVRLTDTTLTHDVAGLHVTDTEIFLNPVDFSKRVVQIIESDFETFVGPKGALNKLPIESKISQTHLPNDNTLPPYTLRIGTNTNY